MAFYVLDVSQNCWIYLPSWNETLIYVGCVFERCTTGLILVSLYLIYYLGLLFGHCVF